VKDFSTIVAPLYEIVKKDVVFKWDQEQAKAFETLKDNLTKAPILTLPNFTKSFEIECDASNIGIGVVLLQESHPIAYFSEKLKGSYLNYSTYDKDFILLLGLHKTSSTTFFPKSLWYTVFMNLLNI